MHVKNKQTRYAHSEGHTDICYDDSGRHLITCGSDGDVRIWEGIDDDDPISHRVGDIVYSVAFKNDRFYTGGDDNAVRVHLFKEGQPDGILLRFSGHVTHMCFNAEGNKYFAASSDFHMKVFDMETSTQSLLQGHAAPPLSISLHPHEHLLASSSCDGSVRVWDVKECKQIKSFNLLPKSNDFSLSSTLCRLTWSKDGKYLFVPVGAEVQAYSSSSWEKSYTLKDNTLTELVSIVALSPCGKYLAGATRDGKVVIWDLTSGTCVSREEHEKKLTICSLAWNPKVTGELAYCDNHGNLSVMSGVLPDTTSQDVGGAGESLETFEDLFDADDDDMMMQATAVEGGGEGPALENVGIDSDDDDDSMIPSLKKRQLPMLDENSRDTDVSSVVDKPEAPPVVPPAPQGPKPTQLQEAFQPGSTPAHLSHRFMIWNTIGLIRQYNTEEENSIDVEFHDTATHHPIHVTNTLNHTMAALSSEAVLLACESDDETPSKLVCMHFGSWDSSKEWSISMPDGEDIQAITLGDGWLAVATDQRMVRVFSVSGVQKETFALPGPIVAMSAHSTQLLITYHKGPGLPGDQNLGVYLVQVSGRRSAVIKGDSLPIAPKSTLAWLGFSSEGTPVAVDSNGLMYLLNRKFANSWTQIANLRSHCKGKSDNYFVVGVQENPAQIRCIACKGNRYPPTLPRPAMAILPFQLPLCELQTEKGQLEEAYWRSKLLTHHLDHWTAEGYDVDEMEKSRAIMPQHETLMKMFALSCKMGREVRAVEICEMMPAQHTVQLAIKYATRLRMMQLAQRLNEVARKHAEEQAREEEEEEEEMAAPRREENLKKYGGTSERDPPIKQDVKIIYVLKLGHDLAVGVTSFHEKLGGKPANRSWPHRNGQSNDAMEEEEEVEEDAEESDGGEMEEDGGEAEGDIYEEMEEENDENENKPQAPALKISSKSEKSSVKSVSTSQTPTAARKNPFKVGSQSTTPTGSVRGSSVFDSLQTSKSANNNNKTTTQDSGDKVKEKKRGFSQLSIFGKKKVESADKKTGKEKAQKKAGAKTAFQLWLEEHREELVAENPDLNEADLAILAAKRFKELPAEEKQEWQEKAKSSKSEEERKRKREGSDSSEKSAAAKDSSMSNEQSSAIAAKRKKPLAASTGNKLANFAFNKS